MKLDTVDERHKVINSLIKKSFKLNELWLHGDENNDDWVANMEILKNLLSLSDMMYTEKIFLDMLDQMEAVPTRYVESEMYLAIGYENLTRFIENLLLHLLDFSLNDLENWSFNAEVGQKFHANVRKKLVALSKKYREIYDLWGD